MAYGSSTAETLQQAQDRIVGQIMRGERDFESVRRGIGSGSTGMGTGRDRQVMQSRDEAQIRARVQAIFANQGITTTTYHRPGFDNEGTQTGFLRDAQQEAKEFLDYFGLTGHNIEQDLWSWVVEGVGPNELINRIRTHPAYDARFPGMRLAREAGLNVPSESAYVAYENSVVDTARRANLPTTAYTRDKVAEYIGAGVSAQEFAERVEEGYLEVATAPLEVRQWFAANYGADGDAALAFVMMDPDAAWPELQKYVGAGYLGGIAGRNNIQLSRQTAERLHEVGIDRNAGEQGFANLREMDSVFQETITETDDLDVEEEGVAAIFNLNPDDRKALERRTEERQAAFGGRGGTTLTRTGTTLGSADRQRT